MIRLKELRTKRKISQSVIAQYLGITQQAYANYERGAREPDFNTLKKLSDYFDVTIDYLLGNDDTPKKSDLTNRDKREIADVIEEYKEQLLSADGLMLDGEMIDEEDVQKIITAMQLGMEMIKKDNKERFTPKKYRK